MRVHFAVMSLMQKLLMLMSILLFIVSIPIDILRHGYMWTSVMNSQEDEQDAYHRLIGHCECFLRDSEGRLPECVRAYSTIWTTLTVLELLIAAALLITTAYSANILSLLSGAYAAITFILLVVFTDCGVLTEDDCHLVYLLIPQLAYAVAILVYSVRRPQQKHQRAIYV